MSGDTGLDGAGAVAIGASAQVDELLAASTGFSGRTEMVVGIAASDHETDGDAGETGSGASVQVWTGSTGFVVLITASDQVWAGSTGLLVVLPMITSDQVL